MRQAAVGAEVSTPSTLQTVERALSFLEVVAESPTPVTVKEVAERLGLNITTCYHLYNTLMFREYVVRQPDLTLRIGHRAGLLYDGYRRSLSTQRLMADFVQHLAVDTAETAWVSSVIGLDVVLTAFSDGPQAVRAAGLYVGLSGQIHRRSSGRAVLAFADDKLSEAMIARLLESLPKAERRQVRVMLDQELPRIAERGWAIDEGDFNPGVLGIAAPYFSADGLVLGAVGIWAPAERGRAHLDALTEKVVAAADEATRLFGRGD